MFDLGFILSNGWRLTKDHYGPFLAAMVTVLVFSMPLGLLNALFPFGKIEDGNGLGDVVGLFFMPMLTVGWMHMGLQAYRGQPVVFGDLFIGFSQYWRIFGATLLLLLIGIGGLILALLGVALFNYESVTGAAFTVAWVVLGVTFLIIVMTRLWYLLILTFVTQAPVMGSIGQSWRATRRVWGRLFVLHLVLFFIAVASIVLLILPFFFVFLPFMVGVTGVVSGLLLEELGDAPDQNDEPNVRGENPAFPEPINS